MRIADEPDDSTRAAAHEIARIIKHRYPDALVEIYDAKIGAMVVLDVTQPPDRRRPYQIVVSYNGAFQVENMTGREVVDDGPMPLTDTVARASTALGELIDADRTSKW